MAIEITVAIEQPDDVEARVVPVTDELRPLVEGENVDEERCGRRKFTGKAGSSLVGEDPSGRLHVLVGVGPAARVGSDAWRRAGAATARQACGCTSASLDVRGAESPARAVQAATEGVLLASYRYVGYKTSGEDDALRRVVLITDLDEEAAMAAVARGTASAGAATLARDLVNEPAGTMTPRHLAARASEVAEATGLAIEILEEDRIVEERLGGLLGVARGSAEPPRLVRLAYEPDPAIAKAVDGRVPLVVLVGKGITFDSGGLSLKTGEGMMTMKTDMSGAAAVIATLGACRAMQVPVRVLGIAPITENMPGGRATKPGDVLTIRNGKTIEVLNTDAEGRLVLADGLSLAVEEAPDAIVDIATLTGACVVALGRGMAGLFGNDDDLVGQVKAASDRAGEPTWHLPLPHAYRELIDSEVADMKNIGKAGEGGAIAAALLLEEFVGDTPWVHLDIAGPARSEEDKDHLRKGATGFSVRTLLELVSEFEPAAAG
jgi:leucyl aminopeptidase